MLRVTLLLILVDNCVSQFTFPELKFEEFSPKGFRVSFPDKPGVEFFRFYGRTNRIEISKNCSKPINNVWSLYEPDLKLRVGEFIIYWSYVIHNGTEYHKNDFEYVVQILKLPSKLRQRCVNSITKINNGQRICEKLIFQDDFHTLYSGKWIISHYMPTLGPNFEFNSYENHPETVQIVNSNLQIKPKVRNSIRGTLDFRNGCTSKFQNECFHTSISAFVLPPVISSKLTSHFSFKYGKVEIRAKLPKGDWIFPEIHLEPRDAQSSESKLLVAYARGNENLVGADGIDIGGKMLFAGPMNKAAEPKRSENLKSYKHVKPLSDEMHTYVLKWEPGAITAFIDNKEYGKLNTESIGSAFNNSEFVITLGVGIGGINDFPDGYVSGNTPKPWVNKDRLQTKKFFDARNQWLPTWRGNYSALQVEYIKIYAI